MGVISLIIGILSIIFLPLSMQIITLCWKYNRSISGILTVIATIVIPAASFVCGLATDKDKNPCAVAGAICSAIPLGVVVVFIFVLLASEPVLI